MVNFKWTLVAIFSAHTSSVKIMVHFKGQSQQWRMHMSINVDSRMKLRTLFINLFDDRVLHVHTFGQEFDEVRTPPREPVRNFLHTGNMHPWGWDDGWGGSVLLVCMLAAYTVV